MKQRKSLGAKLVLSFMITSIIPIILMNLFSYYNTTGIVRDSITEMTEYNLEQTRSYRDLLYQIYSDDEVIGMVGRLNEGENIIVNKNQLQRKLRGFFYTKEYVRSIMIITANGEHVFWDSILGSSAQSSWLNSYGMNLREMYKKISGSEQPCLLPTKQAATMANTENYLFHIGNKIVDYNHRNEQIGVIVMSVDESMLEEICNGKGNRESSFNFLVDRDGYILSYPDPEKIGQRIENFSRENENQYIRYVRESGQYEGEKILIHTTYDEKYGWTVVNAVNQNQTFSRLNTQQTLLIAILVISLLVLIVMIRFFTRNLTGSVKKVVSVMHDVEDGNWGSRIHIDGRMSREVETIAVQYNRMMNQLEDSVAKEQELSRQKQKAEITALEAQINPHFLYNTLDSIIYMIDKGENQKAEEMIVALSKFFRISISRGKAIIPLKDEVEHVRNYLLIQKIRFGDQFTYSINVDPSLYQYSCIKLILQPLVENAIEHGLNDNESGGQIEIIGTQNESYIILKIKDNGYGISEDKLEQIYKSFHDDSIHQGVGLKNVYQRIKIYYGDEADIKIDSLFDEGTIISIYIPKKKAVKNEEK